MKAEERKRLQHNALYDRLLRTWEALKSGSRTVYIILGVVVLLLAAYLGWRWYDNRAESREAEVWSALDRATDLEDYREIAEQHPNTPQGRIARLQVARYLLGPEGIRKLSSADPKVREEAAANIEQARDEFARLAAELAGEPVLQAEAYRGAAQAEESLIGIPKKEGSGWRGSIDRVKEYYEKLAALAPETPAGREAAERVKQIETDRDKIEQFYVRLNEYLRSKAAPPS